jgi:hypothetical protein
VITLQDLQVFLGDSKQTTPDETKGALASIPDEVPDLPRQFQRRGDVQDALIAALVSDRSSAASLIISAQGMVSSLLTESSS